jgi:hypothetical protein
MMDNEPSLDNEIFFECDGHPETHSQKKKEFFKSARGLESHKAAGSLE